MYKENIYWSINLKYSSYGKKTTMNIDKIKYLYSNSYNEVFSEIFFEEKHLFKWDKIKKNSKMLKQYKAIRLDEFGNNIPTICFNECKRIYVKISLLTKLIDLKYILNNKHDIK